MTSLANVTNVSWHFKNGHLLFYQVVFIFLKSTADFHKDAAQAGIEILGAESFVDNPTTQVANLKVS